ncbi:MAG: phosphate ABC transporter permease PstA [Verrucomicrobiota bacterium]|nr:phosphate ABC transporter permease PstA [Verrucomicrobiota bacterium]
MRRVSNRIFPTLCGLCALIACAVLLGLVFVIAQRGLPALSWSFFTEQIRQVGSQGGIFYNLLGTLILILTAIAICAPIATGLALVHSVFVRQEGTQRRLGLFLYTLNGIPSIVFGIFGFVVFVKFFGWGKSWLTGGILLALMILPTVTVALIERIKALPEKYLEAASGLGLRQSQIIWSVILPQSWGGFITGSLLGLARAAGETAPIMFTATIFAGATLPHGVRESPVLSLPYHIFILAQDSFDPSVGTKLWGSALVLLALVFALSMIALPLRLRMHDEAHG